MSGRSRRVRRATAGALVAFAVAAGVAIVPRVLAADGEEIDAVDPSRAAVTYDREMATRRTLSESASVNGTVRFGRSRPLGAVGDGIVTAAPKPGEVVRPGGEVVRIADRPVVLVAGTTPLYRDLRRVASGERDAAGDKIGEQTGDDVRQLQRFLIAEGFDNDGDLTVDGVFGRETERAVKAWQEAVGHPATGAIDRSQMVFVDGALRIDSAPRVGEAFTDLSVGGIEPTVFAPVSNQQRSYFPVGAAVEVELADRTVRGTVADVERQVNDQGSTSYHIEVVLAAGTDPSGIEADDSAKLTAERTLAEDVLTVPVRALVALAEGGWAVQVEADDGTPVLTAVELGEIVDGHAAITGIDDGTAVVVPT